jgi:pre-mRNA-splicing factor 18
MKLVFISDPPNYNSANYLEPHKHKRLHTTATFAIMDLLKREMEKKRKAIELAKKSGAALQDNSNGNSDTKTKRAYLKVGEMKRLEEQRQDENRHHKKHKIEDESKAIELKNITKEATTAMLNRSTTNEKETKQTHVSEQNTMSSQEISNSLRELGLPVWLFGEREDSQRQARLEEAREELKAALAGRSENDEFRLGNDGHNIPNPFIGKKHQDVEEDFPKRKESSKQQKILEEEVNDDPDDPHKTVYKFLKVQLKLWEEDLVNRPDAVKVTLAGKNETKTLKQCKDYIRPLFKQLKSRQLDESLLNNLVKIVKFCKEGEFVKANDAYMDVAIGRAAWPIGVTMVGIHARTGRAKIESSNVAHVMNSESQRKYLTSVKRLMTFCQKKSDVAPSKRVSNN